MAMNKMAAAAAIVLTLVCGPANARGGGRGWSGSSGGGFPSGGGFQQGGSGSYGGGGWQGARANGAGSFARDPKHGEDPYVKAASEEQEKVLKKLNSICRGC